MRFEPKITEFRSDGLTDSGYSYGSKLKLLYLEKILFYSKKHFIFREFSIFREITYLNKLFLHSDKVFISLEIVFIQRNGFSSRENVDIKKNCYVQRKPKIEISSHLS